jgi:hypothetical protein
MDFRFTEDQLACSLKPSAIISRARTGRRCCGVWMQKATRDPAIWQGLAGYGADRLAGARSAGRPGHGAWSMPR